MSREQKDIDFNTVQLILLESVNVLDISNVIINFLKDLPKLPYLDELDKDLCLVKAQVDTSIFYQDKYYVRNSVRNFKMRIKKFIPTPFTIVTGISALCAKWQIQKI
jgi:hypothetical protein